MYKASITLISKPDRHYKERKLYANIPEEHKYKNPQQNVSELEDGSVGTHGSLPCTIIAKIITKLQNNYHPKSSENRAAWKPGNQGIKVTFIRQLGGAEARKWKMHRRGDME